MACMSHALLATAEPISNDDVGVLQRRIRELTGLLAHERLARERAEYKLRDLLRRLYGPKSEQFDSGQYALLLAELEADQSLAQAQQPLPSQAPESAHGEPRRGGGRRPAPEHLPIERVVLDPPAADTAGLVRIREEITEELDYRPSRFIRRHYVRGVYVDPARERAPLIAALPARVLPQAAVGPGLLAHVLVAKYTDHTPLARQERIAAREGVELPRQKLVRWVEGAALLLRSVHERLIERVLGSGYVQVDETPVRVLDPDRGGHAAQAYLWTYLAPRADALVFDFDLSRSRANPTAFFPTTWSGVLQSDGYEVYRRLAIERPGPVHAGCMAHYPEPHVIRSHLASSGCGGGFLVCALRIRRWLQGVILCPGTAFSMARVTAIRGLSSVQFAPQLRLRATPRRGRAHLAKQPLHRCAVHRRLSALDSSIREVLPASRTRRALGADARGR